MLDAPLTAKEVKKQRKVLRQSIKKEKSDEVQCYFNELSSVRYLLPFDLHSVQRSPGQYHRQLSLQELF